MLLEAGEASEQMPGRGKTTLMLLSIRMTRPRRDAST